MIDRRIKFRHIQCFVEIAQERSLKLAADKLNLTQPAISKTLKELEDIIGASLMTRNRAGIALTKQGKVFLHFAQISLASLQQGLDGVEKEGEHARATLKVGVLPSVAASFMPPVIKDLDVFPRMVAEIALHKAYQAHKICFRMFLVPQPGLCAVIQCSPFFVEN